MKKVMAFLTLIVIFAMPIAIIFTMPITLIASPLETLMGQALGYQATVPIIMYHVLEDTPDSMWEITKEEFESDLKYLAQNGFTTVVMQDLIDFVHNGRPLPPKPIVLSFDDGRTPTIDIVLPLLKEHNARITMAIIGKETDHYSELESLGQSTHPHMTWDKVKEMHNTGHVEIQSHTYDLHGKHGAKKLKGESEEAYKERVLKDLAKLEEKFITHIGHAPNSLAYPLGAISNSSDDVIKLGGYLASLSCRELNNTITVGDHQCLYGLNRFLRPPRKSSGDFFAILSDNKMMNE